MKKFFIAGIVLILSLVFISCGGGGTGTGGSSGGTNWDGAYYPNMDDIHKTTVNLNAKTITGGYENSSGSWVYKTDLLITDVSLGTVNTLPVHDAGGLVHSGKWAYVYSGTDKIGLISQWIMSMSGWSETDYDLTISGDEHDLHLGTPWSAPSLTAAYVPLDFTDLVDIGVFIDVEKED